MGSPLTVALAEVRVTHIESSALASSADPPSLYKHFFDDGISRYRDKQHAESFLAHLNSLSDDLVYTVEHSAIDGTLPFLDILLHPDLSTSVYRKPTHTDSYTHYSTSAPQSTKDSLIRSLTRRAYDICSPQHLQHELDHIRTVLLDNGYPLSRITHVMRRTKQSIDLPASAPTQTDKHSVKVFIPYYPHVNKQISSTQFLLHAHPTRIFVIFFPALSLVSQYCKLAMSYIRSLAKTAQRLIADRPLDHCINA